MIAGAVAVDILFEKPRPDHHFVISEHGRCLKESAAKWPIVGADIDNMAKLFLDSLNGIAFDDDRMVVTLVVNTIYCSYGEGRTRIVVTKKE